MTPPDALVVSDLHLGSRACRAEKLFDFLVAQRAQPNTPLVLNGDIFDSLDFRRWPPAHRQVLVELKRRPAAGAIWLAGNHDGPPSLLATLLDRSIGQEHVVRSGNRFLLCLHGHTFDPYLDWPMLNAAGDAAYAALLRLDPSRRLAALAKRQSKHYLHCREKVRQGALERMRERSCHAVACGHTHAAEAVGAYFNSGSWTEAPCTYLEVRNGDVAVKSWPG